jgi:hypothetical protein
VVLVRSVVFPDVEFCAVLSSPCSEDVWERFVKKVIYAAIALAAAAALTACSAFDQANGRGDAKISGTDNSGAEIVNMPDVYGNLATKCHHGNRLYSTTHGSGDDMHEYASQIWVVPADPSCPKDAVK